MDCDRDEMTKAQLFVHAKEALFMAYHIEFFLEDPTVTVEQRRKDLWTVIENADKVYQELGRKR